MRLEAKPFSGPQSNAHGNFTTAIGYATQAEKLSAAFGYAPMPVVDATTLGSNANAIGTLAIAMALIHCSLRK